jgi:peptidoglycan/LPS O-acetylase OafA/YrhL
VNQAAGGVTEIDSLTGARGIAALSIALAHIGLNVNVGPYNLGCFAIIGMPMFFTLSGFIIHYVYAAPMSQGRGFGAA